MGSTDVIQNGDAVVQNGIIGTGSIESSEEFGVLNDGNESFSSQNENVENEIKMGSKWTGGEEGPDRVTPTQNIYTTAPDGAVILRNSYEIDEKPISVVTLLQEAACKFGDRPAIGVKDENNRWKTLNFKQYWINVRTTAKAFLKLGLQRYHSVCILGMNSPEWFYSDLGAIFAGGFAAGIYTTNSPDACLHCLKTSFANIIVVENDLQLQKILKIKDQAPDLKTIIQYTGKPNVPGVLSWNEVMEIGCKESDEPLDAVIKTLAVNECCSLLYTSGTVSLPKAVMLSHDNLIYNTKMAAKYLEMEEGTERILSYLPLSHAAAQTADLYMGIIIGACVYFADKNVLKGTMIENLRSVRPTILFGVPRVWEKIKEGLETSEKKSSGFKQFLMYRARVAGLAHYKDIADGFVGETFWYKFYKRLVYGKVKEALGFDQCRTFLSGAAPIPIEVKEYLTGFDMPITEAYGMSECCGAHVLSKSSDLDFEAAGRALPGCRTKIDKPDEHGVGEVCMFGRHVFMGYLNDTEKTIESLDDEGWLHSGDLGKVNQKTFLQITGRIKDLIITAGGENIAPAMIELSVKAEIPIISQAVLIGDGKKYLTILLTLKSKVNMDTGVPLDELSPEAHQWLKSVGAQKYEKVSEIVEKKPADVYGPIQDGINRVNSKSISSAQKIQKFTILPKDFSLATGELGPTMKVIKRVVFKNYAKEIDDMYRV